MIVEFDQVGRQPNPSYEGRIDGRTVVTAVGSTHSADAAVDFCGRQITIASELHKEVIDGEKIARVTDLMENGSRVGFIYPDLVTKKKIWFLSIGYSYFRFRFGSGDYRAYEIGLGEGQHYFCVYQGDSTMAIIHKNDRKINYRDRYVIYCEDDHLLLPMSVLTVYFDCILYPDTGNYTGGQQLNEAFVTLDEELNSKFDPTFIPRIRGL